MTRFLDWLQPIATAIWKYTSAFVAVLLILAALVIGYRIGRPAPDVVDASTTIQPAPDVSCESVKRFVKGVLAIEGRMISLIELDHLLDERIEAEAA